MTVAITASNAPQSTASFEVILQDGTAQGMGLIGNWSPHFRQHSVTCVRVHSHLSFLYV